MLGYLSFVLWGHVAAAAVLSASIATTTPPPVLHKRAATTVGYYSTGSSGGTTLWGTVTVETEDGIVATSGSQFVVCQSSPCEFGLCSSETFIQGSSTFACGASESLTCSSNLLYQDVSDTAPLTNYFCDSTTETGFTMFRVTPTGPVSASARSTSSASDNDSDITSASEATSATLASSTDSGDEPSSTSGTLRPTTKSKKSTPIGAIVGGVIGGLALIGALVMAGIFLVRRKRAAAPAQPDYAAVPPSQETKPYAGMAMAPPPEKMPANTTYPYAVEVGSVSAPPQSPPPQSPPPQSPAPHYTPHYAPNNAPIVELPDHRM